MEESKRSTGTDYENEAAAYLTAQGVQILERNFRSRRGEIDLVCRDGNYLVFAEVKFRSGTEYGTALDAVDAQKQKQICRVAEFYLLRHKECAELFIRYDVIGIQGKTIQWIRNAFPHRR